MNKRPFIHSIFVRSAMILALILPVGVAAQEAPPKPPTPPDPQIFPLPNMARWTIKIRPTKKETNPAAPDAEPPLQLESISITRTASTRRENRKWSNGSSTETWYVTVPYRIISDRIWVFELAAKITSSGKFIDLKTIADDEIDPSSMDFPELIWLKAQTFRETVTSDKVTLHIYEAAPQPPGPIDATGGTIEPPSEESKIEAAIDANLRRPVWYRPGNGETWIYQYEDPPTSPLQLPEPFARRLDEHLERAEKAAKRRALLVP